MRALHHRDLAAGARLVLDRSAFEGSDHVEPLLLDGVAVLLRLLTREQPPLHRRDAVGQRDLEVHDRRRDRRELAGRLGRRRLLDPRVVPGGGGLRAGVTAARELVRGGDHVDPLHRGLETLVLRPEVEDRHGADRVEIGAHRREGGTLGRELDRQRVLDGRAAGVAARVLRVEVEGAALRERRHRNLDSVDHVGEHLVVGLRGGRDVAGIQSCELIHEYPPVFCSWPMAVSGKLVRSPHLRAPRHK